MPMHQLGDVGLSRGEISRIWHLPPIHAEIIPAMGTVHRTIIMDTDEDKYVLRAYAYQPKDRVRIVTEHALTAFVKVHGVPAVAPLFFSSGETILEYQERFYALYPFAVGQQILREQLTSHEIVAAMGHCLGELHHVLSPFPREMVRHVSFEPDTSETCAQIEHIVAVILKKTSVDAFDQRMVAMLTQWRNWLAFAPVVDLAPFKTLKCQTLHGDYQESNLFFVDGKVSAIIDWDQAYMAPRAWEVLRTLHYVFHLDGPRCQTFLNAYGDVFPLSWDELATTAQAYGWIQAHNLWAYAAFYLEHNVRVRHLLQSLFIPFNDLWAEMTQSFP